MWFTFVTARLFHSLSIQPHLTVALLSSCSVANSPTRRVGLAPTLRPASLAQALLPPVQFHWRFILDLRFCGLQMLRLRYSDRLWLKLFMNSSFNCAITTMSRSQSD